jgi:hypothetical protein
MIFNQALPSANDTHHYFIIRKSLDSIFNTGLKPNSPQHKGHTFYKVAYQDMYKILGFHSGDYEKCHLLRCGAV